MVSTNGKSRDAKKIRLACLGCDGDDCDGISEKELERCIAEGWTDITEEQTHRQSRKQNVDLTVWWTCIGVCPDCQAESNS